MPSVPARTCKGRRQPLIIYQITSTRTLPTIQSQAGFEEFHYPRDLLRWNVSARDELTFKGFLRYHPCKYSYENKLDCQCIDSFVHWQEVICTVLIKKLIFWPEPFHPITCHRQKPTN
jgi:hypothetical protein